MSNLISIGLSGLAASQAALSTTGNNITNVSTAGYSRESVSTTSSALQNIGVGYLGTGTTISDVRRIYNSFMDTQLQTSTALASDATAYGTQASSVDTLLSDSSTGIGSVLSSFFAAVQTASASPNDVSARQALLTQTSTLSNRFNQISSQLSQQNDGINSSLSTLSTQVNKLTSSIADLNKQISAMSTSSSTPNSLLDARNEAVRSLNELVGVTVQQRDGNYDIYLGSGQSLVNGTTANTLTAAPSTADKSQYSLTVNYQGFSSDVTSVTTGGEIGGLLRFRTDVLNPAMNELGRTAIVASDTINTQLAQGVDLNGQFGGSVFASVNSATAQANRSIAASGNSAGSGSLNVAISDSSELTTSDYTVKFTSATAYSVTRSDGTAMGSYDLSTTPAPVIDGFTLALNGGSPSAGDSFKVMPTRSGAADISTTMTDANKLAFAAPLTGTAASGNTGTSSITQPTLTNTVDIYDASGQSDLQTGIANSTPVKLVFGSVSGGSQGYTVFNSKGVSIGTGTVVPGQANTLSISVPMVDASGAAINDSTGTQKTFSFQATVSGTAASGDSYSVAFNSAGKSDNRNATSLLALQTKATVGINSGNAGMSMSTAYSSLVSNVGAKASQATVDTTATAAVLTQAKANRDSVSGVNLDDEAANLVKFQQYYTASSQIIKTAQDIFTTLLNAL
ncbi:flagellar hook-associated protein FlgK [Pseudomonas sp. HR96]|uniref:flagellar hook-associated protein FlgK n=1 Tax=Pseudomonas sp. HR96 TaxID=1027966 RepID=UPI002A75D8E2|nr:flagellar hook-associated protein FlgK [Pseudomonas sp. HR96]WPP01301.1 flagellar hook-associated protein FlgK [Pseudomonas sp. HR96]